MVATSTTKCPEHVDPYSSAIRRSGGGDWGGSRRAAATVMVIAAGTKKIPTENIPSTQPTQSSAAETMHAIRRRRSSGTSATRTGTLRTTKTHEPSTENVLTPEHRVMPPESVGPHLLPRGANAATSAPRTATRNATTAKRFALHGTTIRACIACAAAGG